MGTENILRKPALVIGDKAIKLIHSTLNANKFSNTG